MYSLFCDPPGGLNLVTIVSGAEEEPRPRQDSIKLEQGRRKSSSKSTKSATSEQQQSPLGSVLSYVGLDG